MLKRLFSLRHKGLIASSIIALTVFLVGFYITNTTTRVPKDDALLAQKILSDRTATDIDSDMDTLPDWKERLYGSDIYTTDSDKDGTDDGDEIRAGRNPMKKGPNDQLVYLQDPDFATSSTDLEGIRKEFYIKFLTQRSREIRETTYQDLIKKNVNPEQFRPTSDIVHLNISSDNSPEAVRAYINAFGKLIEKYSVRTHRKEEEILNTAMESKKPEDLKDLQLPAITYRNFAKDLTALSVPSSFAKSHLLIVNGYDGMSKGILGMQHLFTDPISGTAGYESYMRYRFDVTTGYASIVSFIIEKNMVFTKDEPGYPFYWNTNVPSNGKNN